MKVSYNKKLRDKAKESNARLFTFSMTGKGGAGTLTLQGLASETDEKALMEVWEKLAKFIFKDEQ